MSLSASITVRAEADLARQYRWYCDRAGAELGERFLTAFDAMVEKLAAHPGLGWRRRFRAPELAGIRSMPVGGSFGAHLIFYRADGGRLRIERVMHGARDLPRRLLEMEED